VIKHRAFLKWAGGKYRLMNSIQRLLPEADRLVEPFIGAGSVFLNTDYPEYLLCDINKDLINLYKILQTQPDEYITQARRLFDASNNVQEVYLRHRKAFNDAQNPFQRSLYFLYLNRFGYNGLCRYNQSGIFNVPFGRYKKPYFPEKELWFFAEKAQRATFVCTDYRQVFTCLKPGDAVYCDPPYVPLSHTANFTSYAKNVFDLDDQATLAGLARESASQLKIPILMSNHDTVLVRELYRGAILHTVQVQRQISRSGSKRFKVSELFALYDTVNSG
jgi:DNA adenine methylase